MKRQPRREGRTVTVGKLALTIERIDAQTALVGLGFMQVALSVAEMDQLERDLRQARRELFPEGDGGDGWRSVADDPPGDNVQDVLVHCPGYGAICGGSDQLVAYFDHGLHVWSDTTGHEIDTPFLWQPLPEPPRNVTELFPEGEEKT